MLTELSWPWHVDEFGPVFLGITVVGDRDRKQFMRVYVCGGGGSTGESAVLLYWADLSPGEDGSGCPALPMVGSRELLKAAVVGTDNACPPQGRAPSP